ncbi:DUF6401 family natural product biosynthesis protein [Nocardia pseudobrasiliensis]|uniref:Uncharacterized protein n=1 Tax=Nocardia pseudobrasiliensis TaxID=45979 RepID=A0A370I847_9NOCA|nr:DUF6401 family natural product biosynthesis protein [Nocardia pseudobrasiliensis]RDI66895.1 hypothetical protein DFR76_104648 [Nocardia pseudobrasiliensis]
MFLLGSALLEVSARKTLNRLHKTHGVPALAAAREVPAVSAALDQHAAAVRDILEQGVENSAAVPGSVLLAGYARGLIEHSGREALRAPRDWSHADWLQLRLAGVCLLANEKP